LIDVAQDFPEDKFDCKVQEDQPTFEETPFHVADDDFLLSSAVWGARGAKIDGEARS
jgi:hypothetical protein